MQTCQTVNPALLHPNSIIANDKSEEFSLSAILFSTQAVSAGTRSSEMVKKVSPLSNQTCHCCLFLCVLVCVCV